MTQGIAQNLNEKAACFTSSMVSPFPMFQAIWFWTWLSEAASFWDMGVSENSVPLNPMVLLIIIPIKWLFHWEYTQHFQTNPYDWNISFNFLKDVRGPAIHGFRLTWPRRAMENWWGGRSCYMTHSEQRREWWGGKSRLAWHLRHLATSCDLGNRIGYPQLYEYHLWAINIYKHL